MCLPPRLNTTLRGVQLKEVLPLGHHTVSVLGKPDIVGTWTLYTFNNPPTITNCDEDGDQFDISFKIEVVTDGGPVYSVTNTDEFHQNFGSAMEAVPTATRTITLHSIGTYSFDDFGGVLDDPNSTPVTLASITTVISQVEMFVSCDACFAQQSVQTMVWNPASAVGLNPYEELGQIDVAPTCIDCNGDPLTFPAIDPYSICSSPTVVGELWNAGTATWETFEIELAKLDDCLFEADFITSGGRTGTIVIEPLNAVVECPTTETCTPGLIDWKMTITLDGVGAVVLREDNTSCPHSGGWGGAIEDSLPGSPGWRDVVLSYLNVCPELV